MLYSLLDKDPSLVLATDQYELTMAKAYWANGMADREAVFHMSYRANPFKGGFVVWAGLNTLVDILKNFRFSKGDLDYLSTLNDRTGEPLFEQEFLTVLDKMEFACDVWSIPEGTVVFPNEPLVRVQGPILQAQLLESTLLNILNFQSLIATKATRIVLAAEGDPVVDFGLRRAQGLDGALSASRAAYIGGCQGTSNVLAGKLMGIPVMGTHAHSWVMAFDDERASFAAFSHAMPNNCVFLVDTYDTINGIKNAISVAQDMKKKGQHMIGVRLDSGDLAYFSKIAREMLDEAGMEDVLVMGSNELDEYVIRSLKLQGAKINAWGVGTKLVTATDDPALGGVYKLTALRDKGESDWKYKLKLSEQKAKISTPGVLDVYRCYGERGEPLADAILEVNENPKEINMIIDPNDNTHRKHFSGKGRCEPLLKSVFSKGRLVMDMPGLDAIRSRAAEQISLLDNSHKRFEFPHIYPVGLSPRLNEIRDSMITRERDRHQGVE